MTNPTDIEEVLIALRSIGIDKIAGFADVKGMLSQSNKLCSYKNITPMEARTLLTEGKAQIVDVRNLSEYEEGHIDGAKHIMLGTLKNRLDEVPKGKVIMQCRSGARSGIATSILLSKGFKDVVNLDGGYERWVTETQTDAVRN